MKLSPTQIYLQRACKLAGAVEAQSVQIQQAAGWFAETIPAARKVHVFGSGHSRIMVEEMWPRYGSFPGFNPIVELSLSFHNLVVGSNGQRPAMFLENVSGLSHQTGVRETRRVYGEHCLTKADCLGVARFAGKVLLCGAPIEDHRALKDGGEETAWGYVPNGDAYDVPYGTLIPRGRDEVWVAGRCFSATHDAHASCRSMAQTMAMGQAAGAASALSLQKNCGAREVSMPGLQERLRRSGAILEMPGQIAAIEAGDWRRNLTR